MAGEKGGVLRDLMAVGWAGGEEIGRVAEGGSRLSGSSALGIGSV
jgi:hypothetical protein